MEEKPREKFFKVCLCGQKNVGKTSIFNTIRGKPFDANPKAEINFHRHMVNVAGENVQLQIWDTAGMEEYNSLTENYYRSAKAIIAVFSVVCSESLTYVMDSVADVKNCDYAPDAHFFLVGNKIDCNFTDIQVSSERRQNSLEQGPNKFDKDFDTSAKTGKGIKEMFDGVAHALVAAHSKPIVQQNNLISERYKDKPCMCN